MTLRMHRKAGKRSNNNIPFNFRSCVLWVTVRVCVCVSDIQFHWSCCYKWQLIGCVVISKWLLHLFGWVWSVSVCLNCNNIILSIEYRWNLWKRIHPHLPPNKVLWLKWKALFSLCHSYALAIVTISWMVKAFSFRLLNNSTTIIHSPNVTQCNREFLFRLPSFGNKMAFFIKQNWPHRKNMDILRLLHLPESFVIWIF